MLRLLLRHYCNRGRVKGRGNYLRVSIACFYYFLSGLLRVSVYTAVKD